MLPFFFFVFFLILFVTLAIASRYFFKRPPVQGTGHPLSYAGRNIQPVSTPGSFERCILITAKKYKNKVTLVDVVRECGMDSRTAENILKDLSSRNIADMRISENGMVYYVFHDADSLD